MINFKVSELIDYIRTITTRDYVLNNLKVVGEISNLKRHDNGHAYFSIKDEFSKIDCILYDFKFNSNFKDIKEGDEVSLYSSLSINERNGSLSLRVEDLEKVGFGSIYEQFLKLREELDKAGYFDSIHKKPLPKHPKKLGIITAPTGAAVRDIISIATRRNPYLSIYVYPAVVQGLHSEKSLLMGLDYFEDSDMDVIIIGRGGGAYEDLNSFNSKELALKIFDYKIPIVSAVGHEIDVTISDFVADSRAATPSEAAELVVPDVNQMILQTKNNLDNMTYRINNKLEVQFTKLERFEDKLDIKNLENIIDQKLQSCKNKLINCNNTINHRIDIKNEQLISLKTSINLDNMRNRIKEIDLERQTSIDKIKSAMNNRIFAEEEKIKNYRSKMDKWDITMMLNYGYSVLSDEKEDIVYSIKDINIDDELTALVSDGQLKLKVIDIKEN